MPPLISSAYGPNLLFDVNCLGRFPQGTPSHRFGSLFEVRRLVRHLDLKADSVYPNYLTLIELGRIHEIVNDEFYWVSVVNVGDLADLNVVERGMRTYSMNPCESSSSAVPRQCYSP